MSMRPFRTRMPSRSGTASRGATHVDAHAMAAPVPALPKAAAARLAQLDAASMPWLGQDSAAMLVGYDGPEAGGPAEYPTEPAKRQRPHPARPA